MLIPGSLGGGGRSGPADEALERPQRVGLRLARKDVFEAAPLLPPDLLSLPATPTYVSHHNQVNNNGLFELLSVTDLYIETHTCY